MTKTQFENLLMEYNENYKSYLNKFPFHKKKFRNRFIITSIPTLIVGLIIFIILLIIMLLKAPEKDHLPIFLLLLGLLIFFIDGRVYDSQLTKIETEHFWAFLYHQGISTRKQLETLYEIVKKYKPAHVEAILSSLKIFNFILIYIIIPAMFFYITYIAEQEKYTSEPIVILRVFLCIVVLIIYIFFLFHFTAPIWQALFANKMIIAEHLSDDIMSILLFYPDETYDQYLHGISSQECGITSQNKMLRKQ